MRLMLWSLLALNGVAAALWLSGVTVPAAPRPAPPPPALAAKRLELLSELPSPPPRIGAEDDGLPQSPEPALSQSAPAAVEGATAPETLPETPKAEDDPNASAAAPAVDDAVAPAPSVSSAPPSGSAAAPIVPQAAPEPIEPAPPKVPTPAQAAAQMPAAPSGKSTAEGAMADVAACYRTAEFAPDARERVGAALQKAELAPAVLKSSVRPRHWVYWSGAPGAAGSVEQALKAAGVKDWYRVGAGREVTISLGVYGQAEGARRRRTELAAKGVEAKVAERYAQAARQRWQVKAFPSAVEAAQATLASAGVRLEACP